MEQAGISLLIAKGWERFHDPDKFFTRNIEADQLIKDIAHFPHAFVLGSIADRQIAFEKAWEIPLQIKKRAGDFSIQTLDRLKVDDFNGLGHRLGKTMAGCLFNGVKRIVDVYSGDASRIWTGSPSCDMVIKRFGEFNYGRPGARHSRIQSDNCFFTTEAQSSQSSEYSLIENSLLRVLCASAVRSLVVAALPRWCQRGWARAS